MFRNIVLILMSLMLLGCDSKPNIAFINAAEVFNKSSVGVSAQKFLQSQANKLQEFANNVQKQLEEDPKNKELQQYAQNLQMNLQSRMHAEQQNMANTYNTVLLRVVEDYRKNNGLVYVESAQNFLAHDKEFDITAQIIELMNKEKAEFVSVTDSEPLPEAPKSKSSK